MMQPKWRPIVPVLYQTSSTPFFNKYDLTSEQVESASFIFPALGLKTVTSTNLAKISPYSVGLRNYRQYFTNSVGNYRSGVDLTFFLLLPNTDLGNKTFTYC